MICRVGRICGPLALAGLMALQANAQVTQQSGKYLFRLKLVKGMKLNYGVDYSVDSPTFSGGKTRVTAPLKIVITKVEKGIATATETLGPVEMSGHKQLPRSATLKLNSVGKIVGGEQPEMQGATLVLPEKPLKIGETWTANIPMAINPGKLVTVRYKLVRITTVGGRRVAALNLAVTGEATGGGTALISMADGFLVKTQMTIKLSVPTSNGPVNVSAVASVTRK